MDWIGSIRRRPNLKITVGLSTVMAVFLFLGSLGLLFAHLFITDRAQAGVISDLSVSVADKTKAVATTYTISFKIATQIPKDSGRLQFKIYGPDYYSMDFSSATVSNTSSPNSLSIYSRNWDGLTLSTSQAIAANTTITVVLDKIKNPAKGGYYFAQVWTMQNYTYLDGDGNWGGNYNSPYYEIGSNTNLTGTIADAAGTVVPYASVYINNSSYSSNFYTHTDLNGRFGFGDLPADTYTFRLNSPPTYGTGKVYYPPADTTVTIPSSGVTVKNGNFLATPKTIEGKVTRTTGAAVTDASVSINKAYGGGWATADVNSSGSYKFSVPGGTWYISVYGKTYPNDWAWSPPSTGSETVTFNEDASTESKTKNFVVRSLSATVKGKLVKPDGNPVAKWGGNISFSGSSSYPDPDDSTKTKTENYWFSGQLNQDDGTFNAKIAPGTYSVSGWVSDSSLSFPKVDKFTIGENETKDFGTIKMSEKTDKITGSVKDGAGSGVAGVSVSAWLNEPGRYEWGNATTDSSGNYEIKVIAADNWQVSAYPPWKEGGSDYVYTGKPVSVNVKAGLPATASFTFKKASSTIKILLADASGNTLTTVNGWASANDGSQEWSNISASITNGASTLKVPAGKWTIKANIWGGDYSSPDDQVVEIGDNATKSITMKAPTNDAEINGTVYDDAGNPVTNKWLSINATKDKSGAWQSASFDQAKGTYVMKVSAGTWRLTWWIDQSLGLSADNSDAEVTIETKQKKTYDIRLKRNNATLKGRTLKADGSAYPWVWVSVSTQDPNEKKSAYATYYKNGSSSSTNGEFNIKVPAGTYFVQGNSWWGSGYINPKPQKVTVEEGKEVSLDLIFRSADGKISGTAKQDGVGVSAFITAYSEDNGYSQTDSSHLGSYELPVSTGSKWHLTAVRQDGKKVYKTDKELIVDLTSNATATQDLELKEQTFTLPDKKATTFPANQPTTIELTDGMKLTIPAGAITKSGDINVTIEPKATLPAENGTQALNYGHDINVTKTDGAEIKSFDSNVTIEMKYTSKTDDKFNNTEIQLAYYDTVAGDWKELTGCATIDSDTSTTASSVDISTAKSVTVSCLVNHATVFALVAPIDNSPPSVPTNITATAGNTKVTLSWGNPTESDFKNVTIYRSTTQGQLGAKAVTAQTGTSFEDSNLTNATAYYYTVRAVDSSGNESANTAQVSSTPQETTATTDTTTPAALPKTGRPFISPTSWLGQLFGQLDFSTTL